MYLVLPSEVILRSTDGRCDAGFCQQHVFAPGRWKLPLVYPRENFPQVNQSPADLHVLGMQEKPEPAQI